MPEVAAAHPFQNTERCRRTSHARQASTEQQKEQQIISAAVLGKIRKDRLPDGLQRPHQLMDNILQRFDRVTVEKLLHGGHIHIREEVGRVKFRHQHQRAAQRDCTARNAHRDAAPVMPRQRQWVEPKHGLIRAHQSGDGTKQAERAPCGAALIPPGQNTTAQHRQHKRIVKRLLHGGEHIAYRCVEGGQRGSKDCLLLAVQPCSPREKGPPCNHKQQIAPQKSILPAQEKPRQCVDKKNSRPPCGKGAAGGMRFIKAEISLRRTAAHYSGQLLAVDDLITPIAARQRDLLQRYAVDCQLIHKQKSQRRSGGAQHLRPVRYTLTAHKIPELFR